MNGVRGIQLGYLMKMWGGIVRIWGFGMEGACACPSKKLQLIFIFKKNKKFLVICFSHLKWIYKVFVFRYASISIFFWRNSSSNRSVVYAMTCSLVSRLKNLIMTRIVLLNRIINNASNTLFMLATHFSTQSLID